LFRGVIFQALRHIAAIEGVVALGQGKATATALGVVALELRASATDGQLLHVPWFTSPSPKHL